MRITTYDVELNERRNVLIKEDEILYGDTPLNEPCYVVEMMNHIFKLNRKAEEHLYILAMDTKCHIIGVFLLAKGTVSQVDISPREILIRMLLCGASRFVMMHNHPSGDSTPSREDLLVTRRIKESADLIGVMLIDHIIVGNEDYYSLHERKEVL